MERRRVALLHGSALSARPDGGFACALCRFLERSRLSTLPELLSVLRGDLTIFGDLRLRPVLFGSPDLAAS